MCIYSTLKTYYDKYILLNDVDMNDNLWLIFRFTLINYLSRAMWDGNIFSSYIYLLTGNSTSVGIFISVIGFTQLICAPLNGIISDSCERQNVLKVTGTVGFLATLCTIYAVATGSYDLLYVSMFIWGGFWSSSVPTIDSVLADNSEEGTRSRLYCIKLTIQQLGSSIGPFIGLCIFYHLGNHWSISGCKYIILSGLIAMLFGLPYLFLFKPSHAHDVVSDHVETSKYTSNDSSKRIEMVDHDNSIGTSGRYLQLSQSDHNGSIKYSNEGSLLINSSNDSTASCGVCSFSLIKSIQIIIEYISKYISYPASMIAFSDVVTGAASGLTIPFFPIYFMKILQLSPITIQAIYVVTPFILALLAMATQSIGAYHGRILTTCVTKGLGVMLLIILTLLTQINRNTYLIIFVYILRTALMSSAKPLTKSIIMDIVPKNQRGRWNSIEVLDIFVRHSSALLGGYLIDKYGILTNFTVTAIMQGLAIVPLVLISSYVALESDNRIQSKTCSTTNSDAVGV